MSILDLPVDVIALVALDLDLPNILSLCESNVKFNRAVCKKESFWLNKLLKDFPEYKKLKENYRETYKLLYNLTQLKKKLNLDGTVDKIYEMKRVNLDDKRLKEIPKELGSLPNLQTLFLPDNQISTIPKELGNLHNLQELNLSNNRISTIPKELGNLHNLEILDLDNNQISTIPKELSSLHNLQSLYLGSNPIKEISEGLEHLLIQR